MEKKKLSIVDMFTIASGQFGCMVGGGVTSGTTLVLYYVSRGGIYAPFAASVAILVLFLMYYLSVEIGRKYSIDSYDGLFKLVYGKASIMLSPLADVSVLLTCYVCILAVFAGSGSYFNQMFGWPILAGALGSAVICLFITYKGLEFFSNAQGLMSIVMFGLLFSIYVVVIFYFGKDELAIKFATRWVPEGFSIGSVLWWTTMHCSGLISFVAVYMLQAKKFNTRKEILGTMGIGIVCNCVGIVLPIIALLCYAPQIFSLDVPALYLISDVVNFPAATLAYSLLLIFAWITTGSACLVTINERLKRYIPQRISHPKVHSALLPLLICAVSVPLSLGGLLAVYSRWAPISAALCVVMLFIPLVVRGPILLSKKRPGNDNQSA